MKITIDRHQGRTNQTPDGEERRFGYICGDDGGWFFTWMDTLEETLDTIEIDEIDGDGGISYWQAMEFLEEAIEDDFNAIIDDGD